MIHMKRILIFLILFLAFSSGATAVVNVSNSTVFTPWLSNINYIVPDPWFLADNISLGPLCLNITNFRYPGSGFAIENGTNPTFCGQSSTEINVTIGTGILTVTIYDEQNNTLVTHTNVTVSVDKENSSIITQVTDTGSTVFYGLEEGIWTITLTADGYQSRSYFVTVSASTPATLNAFLILDSQSNDITFIVRDFDDGQFVEDVVVTLQKKIGASYVTMGQKTTDFVGSVFFGMEVAVPYRMTFSHPDYFTRSVSIEIEPTDSSFELLLTQNVTLDLDSIFSDLLYSYIPIPVMVEPLNNSNFSLSVTSIGSTLSWFSVSTDLNGTSTTNVTGSPAGGVAQITKDLTFLQGETFQVKRCMKSINFDLYCFNTTHMVNPLTTGNYSLPSIVTDARTIVNIFTDSGRGELILNIFALLITSFIIAALSVSGMDPKFASGIGIFMLIGASFLGVFDTLIAFLVAFLYFALLLMSEVIT